MADKSFKVKNTIIVNDVEIDPSSPSDKQILRYVSNKFIPSDSDLTVGPTAPSNTSVLWADTSETGEMVVPSGGTTGQVLAKLSNNDYDTQWETRAKIINTDGDPGTTIYVGTIDPDTLYTLELGDVWMDTNI